MVRSQSSHVLGIGGRYYATAKTHRSCHDHGVDGRTDPGSGSQTPREANGAKIETRSAHPGDEQTVNASIRGVTSVNLGEHGQRHHPERTLRLRPPCDGNGTRPEYTPSR
jgi:hypothetical protein